MNREEFFAKLTDRSADEFEKIQWAYWLAKDGHRNQQRDTGERYFEHPRRVATLIIDAGRQKTEAIILALLHDKLEDTVTPPKVIVSLFGTEIWKALEILSKQIAVFDPVTGRVIARIRKKPDRYFQAIARAKEWVRIVKAADRLDNLATCGAWDAERKSRYAEETREKVLPIAEATHPWIAKKIVEHLVRIERDVASCDS